MSRGKCIAIVALVGLWTVLGVGDLHGQSLASRRAVVPPPMPFPLAQHRPQPRVTPLVSPLTPPATVRSADDQLFGDALREQTAGNMRQARKLFYELIKNHPTSRHIPAAYLSFADHFFAKGTMANAIRFYRKVLQSFRSFRHRDYVYTKMGWAELNLGKYQDALQHFFSAARLNSAPVLQASATHGFVTAYSHIGKAQTAYRAFKRHRRSGALAMLERLANIYSSQGKFRQAVFAWRQLIQRRPNAPTVCNWQLNVAASMSSIGNKQRAVRETINLMRLVLALRKHGTSSAGCERKVQDFAYWQASTWQRQAHVTKSFSTALVLAARIYDRYQTTFPSGRHIADVRYFHAEVLWRFAQGERVRRLAKAKWLRAAAAFGRVVTAPGQPRSQVTNARHAARLASQNAARF